MGRWFVGGVAHFEMAKAVADLLIVVVCLLWRGG